MRQFHIFIGTSANSNRKLRPSNPQRARILASMLYSHDSQVHDRIVKSMMHILEVFRIRCSNSPPFDERASPILVVCTYRHSTYLLARSTAGDGGQPAGRHQPKQMINIRISKTSNFRVSKYPSLMPFGSYYIVLGRCHTSKLFNPSLAYCPRSNNGIASFLSRITAS
jgi:hypothetical protein